MPKAKEKTKPKEKEKMAKAKGPKPFSQNYPTRGRARIAKIGTRNTSIAHAFPKPKPQKDLGSPPEAGTKEKTPEKANKAKTIPQRAKVMVRALSKVKERKGLPS